MVDTSQVPLRHHHRWTVKLSETWDVLGPFPIHAREQQFLSPSFPLQLPDVIDYNKTWPSSYADGGKVSWTKFQSDANGDLKVSFPNIRWSALRATEGWAALQYHSVLRTSVTVSPPPGISTEEPPRLHVRLAQGSFFCVIPTVPGHLKSRSLVPTWYSGNIYDLEQALPQIIDLPALPSLTDSTTYDLFVSGDYEIRLFGDPRAYSASDTPVLSINVAVEVENPVEKVVWDPSQDVTCDFVDGFVFGDAFGFGLRSVDGWWTVKSVTLASDQDGSILLHLLSETRIAPTQTRIVPLRIIQSKQFLAKELRINVTAVSDTFTPTLISLSFPIHHHSKWTSSSFKPIKASYFFAESMPTPFVVLPPRQPNDGEPRPPILALHGAGVKILEQSFWADSLPRQQHSWVIMPTGRTSWGLDWHGPSAQDAWASVDALIAILHSNKSWHSWSLTKGTPVVLFGHSNGGQGAWHMASKYPDRVLAVVSAAGYIKSQLYVPLTMSRSQHFIDPSLRAILDTALTGDDNDLFMSNLVDTPILAIHGGRDDNVPTWHSREIFGVLKTWNPNANVTSV
ncbi:hypothetical protein PILCRDRAFT_815224 [Piloderma croceum F 1598]|uniref:AB hydrolase-1 domain-containing protein n=1 Tax=Piloderma croceum (strain F 1598) TaxID=765440 RepID=A0A0C3G7C1_PILCF|nr:hypothetical protein PILCRDRAFT_815224 [Piloderma croceum F 1598]